MAGPWKNDWQPSFQNPDLERSTSLACGDHSVDVYVAAYASALQGKELISSSHYVVPLHWDRFSDVSSYTIRNRGSRDYRVGEIRIDTPGYKALVWHWFEIDDRVAAGPAMAKALQVLALLGGQPAGGRVVVIETDADDDIQQSRERLEEVAVAVIEAESR